MKRLLTILFVLISATAFGQFTRLQIYQKIDGVGTYNSSYIKALLDSLNKSVAYNAEMTTALAGKQATLVSGTNIKTLNGSTLLGSGDFGTVLQSGQAVTFSGTTSVSGSGSATLSFGTALSRMNTITLWTDTGIEFRTGTLGGGTNPLSISSIGQMTLRPAGINGSVGQVLTHDGTYAIWQDPANSFPGPSSGTPGDQLRWDAGGDDLENFTPTLNPCITADCFALWDGSTFQAASFEANDFNITANEINLDYANGQAATSGQDGFLQSADWATFNNKQASGLSYLLASGGTLTGANNIIGSATNTFTMTFNNLGTTITPGAGIYLRNTTALTGSGDPVQRPPSLMFEGQGGKSAAGFASQPVRFQFTPFIVNGTTAPSGSFTLASSINNSAANTIFTAAISESNTMTLFTINGPVSTGAINTGNATVVGSLQATALATLNIGARLGGNATDGGYFELVEDSDNGTNRIRVQAPASLAGDTDYRFPGTAPTVNGLSLTSTTGGTMSWTEFGSTTQVLFNNSGAPSGDADMTFSTVNNTLTVVNTNVTGTMSQNLTNTNSYRNVLQHFPGAASGAAQVVNAGDIPSNSAISIVVTVAAKDADTNTGWGGIFKATWTSASGTLQLVGEDGITNIVNDTGGVLTLATSDSSGNIVLTYMMTGIGNQIVSWIADVTIVEP